MNALRTISIILFFVVVAAISIHSLDSINQDIGRHLKTGEIIWQTKSVPKVNLFSFTEPNTPFVNHHWLSEVVFFLLAGLIGLKGLILFKAAVILFSFWLVYKSVSGKARSWAILVAGLFAVFIFSTRTDVRPEIFSYLFLSFFIFAILKAKYGNDYKWLGVLPVIELLWVNMHIYFAIGPALLLVFLIDRLIARENKTLLKKLLLILILTSVVTLINPNFIRGALVPFTILQHYGYSIVENQSIFFLKDYGVILKEINLFELSLILLIVSFVVAFKNKRKEMTFEFLSAIIVTLAASKMVRNFGIYALVFIPIVSLNLSASSIGEKSKKPLKVVLYFIFIAASLFTVRSVINNKFYSWLHSPKRFGLEIPVGAQGGVDFVKQNQIKGPVFNNFDVGSFLIWKLYPEQKVFVDGRPEAYTVDFFEKIYKPMQTELALWQKYSEIYHINYVFFDYKDITPWAQTFLTDISQNPNWPLVYADNSVVIFLKMSPENQKLIQRFQIKNRL